MIFLNNLFLFIAARFVDIVGFFYRIVARFFGYPNNPGMPAIKPEDLDTFFAKSSYPRFFQPLDISSLPHTWAESFIAKAPPLTQMPKFFYQSQTDGFYSFYIDLYSNNYFLPDWLSEWLQLTFNISLDTTFLEFIQEGIFVFLIIYMKFIAIRINLFWFITINPFIRPWIYITSLVDWAYDITAGIVPGLFGVDVGIVLFFSIIGKLADIVNSIIFTMPFLPSEGELGEIKKDFLEFSIDSDVAFLNDDEAKQKTVIFFRNLPYLWYTHPIPNDIREFWFHKRPDILNYMVESYKQLEINFYPDDILKYLEKYNVSLDDFSNIYLNNIEKLHSASIMNSNIT
uniref:Ycf89 n=1 Tax=Toxarium undulatum TaxID=210620 RepID=A0A1D8DB58_9STRA|nr:hypothetical protein [Toxarium undulatum]YP_009308950.1 hypothetical protein [Toxarium undulatum]AOS86629.1 hypothetical protein [Toxarium undulatum]AOS86693.1 hypothetical protein [Toxarium undulatum]